MTVEQLQLLAFKGMVASLTPDQQQTVAEAKAKIDAIQSEAGELGVIAVMLAAMETAAK